MAFIASMNEALSLVIASIVVALVFGSNYLLAGEIVLFTIITAGAIIAMIPHELAHRWIARRLGCYSRYVLSPTGLLLTLITAIPYIPFKIIMPGFTLVVSNVYDPVENKRINGIVSYAGPVTNMVIASASLLILESCLKTMCLVPLVEFLYWNALLNSWVSFFNLLPIPPLDGSKIITWKPLIWAVSFAFTIAMFVMLYIGLF